MVRSAIETAVNQWEYPLVFLGCAGSGKTCAAQALSRNYRTKFYISVYRMNEDLIAASKGELFEYGEKRSARWWWKRWEAMEICVLDEIAGRQQISDFHYENVKYAIDSRHGKPLVLISNLGIEQIEKIYDDRIASRMMGGSVIEFPDIDRRIQRKSAP